MAIGFGNELWRRVEELEHRVRVTEMELGRFKVLEELIKKFGLCHPDVQVARVDLPLAEPYLPPIQPTTNQQPNREDQKMK